MQSFTASAESLSPLPGVMHAGGISLIRVSGADAVHFLHCQFTQAVENLGSRTTLAGYCSPKGRLLALMRVWMEGDDVMLALRRRSFSSGRPAKRLPPKWDFPFPHPAK